MAMRPHSPKLADEQFFSQMLHKFRAIYTHHGDCCRRVADDSELRAGHTNGFGAGCVVVISHRNTAGAERWLSGAPRRRELARCSCLEIRNVRGAALG